jgi:tetratricopeptide (TPR) repeat protein
MWPSDVRMGCYERQWREEKRVSSGLPFDSHDDGEPLDAHRQPDAESNRDASGFRLDGVSPDLAARILAASVLTIRQGQPAQALALMREAPALRPDALDAGIPARDHAAALLAEADSLFQLGQYADALRSSARGLRLAPQDPHAWFRIAMIFSTLGESTRALKIVHQGLGVAPGTYGLLMAQGSVLTRLRRYEEALPIFEHLTRSLPTDQQTWMRTAHTLIRLRRAREAIAPARRAVSLPFTTGSHAWRVLGDALRGVGDYTGARAAYEEQLRRTPDSHDVRARLALAYAGEFWRGWRWPRTLLALIYAALQTLIYNLKMYDFRAEQRPSVESVAKEEHLDTLLSEA